MAAEPGVEERLSAAPRPLPVRPADSTRFLAAEAGGSGLLTFLIVASGVLAERFAGGNIGLAVLITALSGTAGFFVLARSLSADAPSLFNPGLALVFAVTGRLDLISALLAAAAQIAGAFIGVMVAHLVTNTGMVQVAAQIQKGLGVWTGEMLATGLFVFAVLKTAGRPDHLPLTGALAMLAVALATPSLSFANPAVTLARTLTDSFTAIALMDAVYICGVQCAAAIAVGAVWVWQRSER
jgi:glycerol uptake facilitator-like aquaporin